MPFNVFFLFSLSLFWKKVDFEERENKKRTQISTRGVSLSLNSIVKFAPKMLLIHYIMIRSPFVESHTHWYTLTRVESVKRDQAILLLLLSSVQLHSYFTNNCFSHSSSSQYLFQFTIAAQPATCEMSHLLDFLTKTCSKLETNKKLFSSPNANLLSIKNRFLDHSGWIWWVLIFRAAILIFFHKGHWHLTFIWSAMKRKIAMKFLVLNSNSLPGLLSRDWAKGGRIGLEKQKDGNVNSLLLNMWNWCERNGWWERTRQGKKRMRMGRMRKLFDQMHVSKYSSCNCLLRPCSSSKILL